MVILLLVADDPVAVVHAAVQRRRRRRPQAAATVPPDAACTLGRSSAATTESGGATRPGTSDDGRADGVCAPATTASIYDAQLVLATESKTAAGLSRLVIRHAEALQGPTVLVAVLGLFNRGKTFVLNQLAGLDLPSGWHAHTLGLAFKRPLRSSARSMLLLDTAGLDNPGGTEPGADSHRSTDALVKALAVHLADVLLFVVSDTARADQAHLDTLCASAGDDRPVIVIHNFMSVDSLEAMARAWQVWRARRTGRRVGGGRCRSGGGMCRAGPLNHRDHP